MLKWSYLLVLAGVLFILSAARAFAQTGDTIVTCHEERVSVNVEVQIRGEGPNETTERRKETLTWKACSDGSVRAHFSSWDGGTVTRNLFLKGTPSGDAAVLSGKTTSTILGRVIRMYYRLEAKLTGTSFVSGEMTLKGDSPGGYYWYGVGSSTPVVPGTCAAETCQGDYEIENETDLVAIAQCESISGDLTFAAQDWLTSLDLPSLTSVGGSLEFEGNASLTSLSGLSSLTSVGTVGHRLSIKSNACLSQDEAEAFAAALGASTEYVYDNGANYPCN